MKILPSVSSLNFKQMGPKYSVLRNIRTDLYSNLDERCLELWTGRWEFILDLNASAAQLQSIKEIYWKDRSIFWTGCQIKVSTLKRGSVPSRHGLWSLWRNSNMEEKNRTKKILWDHKTWQFNFINPSWVSQQVLVFL